MTNLPAACLDELPLTSAVTTHDGLVWQASHRIDTTNHWTNTQDGWRHPLTSTELAATGPVTLLRRPDVVEQAVTSWEAALERVPTIAATAEDPSFLPGRGDVLTLLAAIEALQVELVCARAVPGHKVNLHDMACQCGQQFPGSGDGGRILAAHAAHVNALRT